MLREALQVRTVLHGRESGGRAALAGYLRRPRYEVLPTEDVEGLVTTYVPPEVTITITAVNDTPVAGDDGISTTEDFAKAGFTSNAYVADPKEWAAVFHMPHDRPPGLWRMAFPVHPESS